MSVRVNLLPAATKARSKASQQRAIVGASFGVLLVALGGVWFWGSSQVRSAEAELAAEQARTAQLRTEQSELVAFRDLADRRDAAHTALKASLGTEVSFAGVLQDVAAVLPSDTQLEALTVQLADQATAPEVAIGSFTATGKTLTSHAPGVERVLIQLDKVVSFRDLYLNSSSLEDPEDRVAAFSLDGRIGAEARTGRYADGLPEELR